MQTSAGLDAEGSEPFILSGMDWDAVRPRGGDANHANHAYNTIAGRILQCLAWNIKILVARKSRRYGMASAHIPVFFIAET